MVRHDGVDAVVAARVDHAPVVIEGVAGELTVLGLDARPLDREPVRAEAELGQQRDVLRVPPEVVARVTGWLGAARSRRVLPRPPVVVPVAAFDLVRGSRRAPQEAVWKRDRHESPSGAVAGSAHPKRPYTRPAMTAASPTR